MLDTFKTPETARTFAGYVVIGVVGVALYFILLWCFVRLGFFPLAAFTLSYVIAITVQFFLNKYLNFRSFERAIHQQAGTYVAIAIINYAIMIAVEEFGLHVLHMSPLMSYALSIPVNLPVSYLAHRFLTFGPGIIGAFRNRRKARQ